MKVSRMFFCSALAVVLVSSVWAESFNEVERREYLKPQTSPMVGVPVPVTFQDGDGADVSSRKAPLNGRWTLTLQDGRVVPAAIPGSIYTDLWKSGLIGDPYFGTNDLLAATFSAQTNVYRCSFACSPRPGARCRLSFGGVSDVAEVSLNGKFLGSHIGMFEGFEYELDASALKGENVLEVKLLPLLKQEETLTCIITRGFHYCNLPSIGIWRPVTLDEIPDAEVRRQFIVTRSAERREMDYRVDIHAARDGEDELRLCVRPCGRTGKSLVFSRKVRLVRGENVFRYSFALPEAELWWPVGYGKQAVYEMTASLGDSSITDEFGIRTFRFEPGPDGPKTNLYIPWYHSAQVIREPIFDMARRGVLRLRNHPSLVVWGGGNELCHNKDFTVHDEVINTVGRTCLELDGTRDFWRTDPYAGSEHHHISWSGWTPDQFLRHYAGKEGVCQNATTITS